MGFAGLSSHIEKASELFGFEILNKEWEMDKTTYSAIKPNKLTNLGSLKDVSPKHIPEKIAKGIKSVFNVGNIYSIGVLRDGLPFGNIMLVTDKEGRIGNADELCLFCGILGAIFKQMKSEEELTDSKKILNALKESEENLLRTNSIARVGYWHLDISTMKYTYSKVLTEILELEDSEIYFEKIFGLVNVDYREQLKQSHVNAVTNGQNYQLTLMAQTAKGKQIWLKSIVEVEKENGKPVHLKGVILDITDHYQLLGDQKQIANELYQFHEVLNKSSLISYTDLKGTILYANENFSKLSKYSTKELIGKNHRIVNSGYHSKVFWKEMWAVVGSGGTWRSEVCNKAKDGSLYWVDAFVTAINDMNGKPFIYYSVRNNITEKKISEEKLVRATEEAQAANKSKSEFLANMSHEIRTPLNAVIGYSELLKNKIHDKNLLTYINGIALGGNNLLALINDILDLSKIESGHLAINLQPVSIQKLHKELEEIFRAAIEEKKINFTVNYLSPEVTHIVSNETRLRQIFFNLVGNAIKFTDIRGYVKVEAACVKNEEYGDYSYTFKVSDTGIGIAPDQFEKIFEAFKQQDGQSSRKYGGTGLGLTITNRLVGILGGNISVRSELNKGSEFVVEFLHIKTPAELEISQMHAAITPGKKYCFNRQKILIVEDNELNRNMLLETLSTYNLDVAAVSCGAEALKYLAKEAVDLILTDIMMPEMDGIELCRRLKSNLLIKDIPVFFLSADTSEITIKNAFDVGGENYLSKPYNESELLLKIHKQFDIDKSISSSPILKNKGTIAIIDDNDLNRHILHDYLKEAGFQPNSFPTAFAFFNNQNINKFDVVLMDIEMPQVNGWEAFDMLRMKNFTKPVIAISAHSESSFKEKCLNKGFDDIICKPIYKADLIKIINKHFDETNKILEDIPDADEQVIDLSTFLKITQSDMPYRIRAYKEFTDLLTRIISAVEKSSHENTTDQVIFNDIHSFKNVANYFCRKSAVATIKSLEKDLDSSKDFSSESGTQFLKLMRKIEVQLKGNAHNIM